MVVELFPDNFDQLAELLQMTQLFTDAVLSQGWTANHRYMCALKNKVVAVNEPVYKCKILLSIIVLYISSLTSNINMFTTVVKL